MSTLPVNQTNARPGPVSWRAVAVYLLIAFGFSWVAQIVVARTVGGSGILALGSGLLVLVTATCLMWPPAVGAFVARRWLEGGSFTDAGLRRGPWRFLALAWFGPALFTGLAVLLSLPFYAFDPSFAPLRDLADRTGQPLPADPALIVALQAVAGLTLAVPVNAVFAFGEEFGWRGYLLPRLMSLLGPWPGLLAHGAVWGFWHAPLIVLIGYNYPGHNLIGVPMFVVFGVLAGVLLGWLRLASGSVWPPTIAHAAFNAIAGLPLLLLRDVDPAVAGPLHSPAGWAVLGGAIALLLATGALPRLMRRSGKP